MRTPTLDVGYFLLLCAGSETGASLHCLLHAIDLPGGFVTFPHQRHEHRAKPACACVEPAVAGGQRLHRRRALTLLFQGQAQVVVNAEDGSFHTFDFQEWRNISAKRAAGGIRRTISFRIRVRESFCCSSMTGCRRRR